MLVVSSQKPLVVENSAGRLSGDAGLLVVREFDQKLRLTEQIADVIEDRRDPEKIEHSLLSMVRQRVYGILAGSEDQNDHDTLRYDPVFQLICDRIPREGAPSPPVNRPGALLVPQGVYDDSVQRGESENRARN